MRVMMAGLLCLVLGAPAYAAGPVFVVNSFSDVADLTPNGVCETAAQNQVCTLRAAVMEANRYAELNGQSEEVTIELQVGTYDLTLGIGNPDDQRNGDLNLVAGKVRIVGKGAGWLNGPTTMVHANHGDRLFSVSAGASVTFVDLRIDGGRPPTGPRDYNGAGILALSGSTVTVDRCLVRDNVNSGSGGGIYAFQSTLVVRDSNFRLNSALYGGAVRIVETAASVLRSTFNSNGASVHGGAVDGHFGSLKATNVTISDNYSASFGGGLYLSEMSSVLLNNVTLAINRADNATGPAGAGLEMRFGTATISNSILYNVRGPTEIPDDLRCAASGGITSNGHNLIFAAGDCSVNGAFSGALPQIYPLAGYGGPMATRALAPGSDAVNAGIPTGCEDTDGGDLTTDQRGVKRPIGSACDLGAFELEPIGDANGDGFVTVADVLYLINYLFAGGPWPVGRANVNGGDGTVNVADVLFLINYLFAGGPVPA